MEGSVVIVHNNVIRNYNRRNKKVGLIIILLSVKRRSHNETVYTLAYRIKSNLHKRNFSQISNNVEVHLFILAVARFTIP